MLQRPNPSYPITEKDQLRQQLLRNILRLLIPFIIVVSTIVRIIEPQFVSEPNIEWLLQLVVAGICIVLYFLNERGHVNTVAFILMLALLAGVFVISIPADGWFTDPAAILMSVVVLAGILLPNILTIIFVGISMLATGIWYIALHDFSYQELFLGPFAFIMIAASPTLFLNHYRSQISRINRRYQHFFDFGNLPFCIHDGESVIQTNHSFETLIGNVANLRLLDQFPESEREKVKQSLQLTTSTPLVTSLSQPDNSLVPVEIISTRYFEADQKLFFTIIRDLTAQRKAEDTQLRLLSQERETTMLIQLISDISHDVRTPLTIIQTSLYLLERTKSDEDRGKRIDTIRHQTDRLLRMFDDILYLTRLDKLSSDLESWAIHDLSRFVQTIVANHQTSASQFQHKLRFHPADTAIKLSISPDDMEHAIDETIQNAINYTPQGGEIDVSVYEEQDDAIIKIVDNGIGIPPDDLPNLFDRFYRVDSARNTDTGGMGLGLSIAKKVVELHNGTISVESTEELGTTVLIRLRPSDLKADI